MSEVRLPLTEAQSGIWFSAALDEGNPVFNCAQYLALTGPLRESVFERALRATIAEAEALHARFGVTEGRPWQRLEQAPEWALDRIRVTDTAAALAWMRADLAAPVDVLEPPLFRFALVRTDSGETLWYQRIHHLLVDGYGFALVQRRVAERYAALLAGTEPKPHPFRSLHAVLEDEARYRSSPRYTEDARFWRQAIGDALPITGLTETSARTARRFERHSATVGSGRRLTELGPERGALLVACTALYTSALTGTREVVLGLPMMNRLGRSTRLVPTTAVNVLPLRVRVEPGATMRALAERVAAAMAEVSAHQWYRGEQLRRDLGMLTGRLFGPQVNLKPFEKSMPFGDCTAHVHYLAAGPVDDLEIIFTSGGTELGIDIDVNPQLYPPEVARAHLDRLTALIETVAADPDRPVARYPVLRARERTAALAASCGPDRVPSEHTLLDLLDAAAKRFPDHIAVRASGHECTYRELHERAGRLAEALAARGAGPGTVVAIGIPRGIELLAGLLGILKAGAAYLPVEEDLPRERVELMLADAAPVQVLYSAEAGDLAVRPRRPRPEDPAYLLYTSGSTGKPKGVVVSHRAIVHRLRWMQERFALRPRERVLQKTPAGFDVSVWEFFWPLCQGASVVFAEPGGHRDPGYLARLIAREHIGTVHFVPSMLRVFLDAGPDCAPERVICSGEALSGSLAADCLKVLGTAPHNLYGPTEAAVDVTAWHEEPGTARSVPIGVPMPGNRCYVLDTGLRLCPDGVPGELYLAGAQLARGYHDRATLTAQRFHADPFGVPGSRMYRTGDLALRRTDGAIEYLGRGDDQVKIRGMRVEPGETEAALTALPGVATAAVLARADRLCGYAVPMPGIELDGERLRTALHATLPARQLPDMITVLPRFPVTHNGKLDRAALPDPVAPVAGRAVATDPAQELIAAAFAEVLELERVGTEDGFFELGGHSLHAARVVARLRELFNADLGIGDLFAAPTVAGLAERLAGDTRNDPLGTLFPLRAKGNRPPLYCVHPAGGLGWCYAGLLRSLPAEQPVYALQSRGLDGRTPPAESIEEMAAAYVDAIATPEHGRYLLAGWSVGGVIAHAMACELTERGAEVGLLAMLDAYPSEQWQDLPEPDESDAARALLFMAGTDAEPGIDRDTAVELLRTEGSALATLPEATRAAMLGIVVNNARRMREHRHRRFAGDLLFFEAGAPRAEQWLDSSGWLPHIGGELRRHRFDCTHPELIRAENLDRIGSAIAEFLDT
ncbi:non-ribosomal peptide synthetase [Sciscionella marina]|uniref:non-ribosomal peptide synthetase n=1 Tax=Sciscionella marina TaxID=508770 RepID=UPI00036A1BE1|nr:non-ribosomal peptide synthetase [Sciscionella marina]